MTISRISASAFLALAVSAGLVLSAGFSPAGAVESTDTNRGNGDQTQAQTAPPPSTEAQHSSATPLPETAPATTPPSHAAAKPPTPASRAGLRVGRLKLKTLQTTGRSLSGVASFYGADFHGRRTASGERFNMNAMTLACRRLPMGTRVRVTNLRNGKTVVGRVNDLGPNGRFRRTRVADLSKGMARKIGFTDGLTRVRLEVLK